MKLRKNQIRDLFVQARRVDIHIGALREQYSQDHAHELSLLRMEIAKLVQLADSTINDLSERTRKDRERRANSGKTTQD